MYIVACDAVPETAAGVEVGNFLIFSWEAYLRRMAQLSRPLL